MTGHSVRRNLSSTVFSLGSILGLVSGWVKWTDNGATTDAWKAVWGKDKGPSGRIGHSMVLQTDTKVIMFGGKDNDIRRTHTPKTYEITRKDGSLEFVNYNDKYVLDCQAALIADPTSGDGTCTLDTPVGLYYNDVWEYDLSCDRQWGKSCPNSGWTVLHPGARLGGCKYFRGEELCTVPSERWGHAAAMFDDNTMLIYGGYSRECGDYCDDVWSFDLRRNLWMEIYKLGHLSESDEGPGKRWRFGLASDGLRMFIFGGHRLWHGFAGDNAESNRWSSRAILPTGGYLDDLWIYDKVQLKATEPNPTDSSNYGTFSSPKRVVVCEDSPGLEWSKRNDQTCSVTWPQPRAGHQMVWDEERGGLWIHGGYTTYFPYISSDGAGSAMGVQSTGTGGFKPYPSHEFYLDDLWFYDLASGMWTQVEAKSTDNPAPRMDHVLVKVAQDLFILNGGYSDNTHFDDTWQFNTTTSRWLLRTQAVLPEYPIACTDDLAFVAAHPECVEQQWTKPMERSAVEPWEIQQQNQSGYWPGAVAGAPYYKVLRNGEAAEMMASGEDLEQVAVGTPVVPYAGIAPRQYIRPVTYQKNSTSPAIQAHEYCTNVYGEPTRGTLLDGLHGRASEPVLIAQPRRQAPGWDGCRDRPDGNKLLPNQLQWLHPNDRSAAAAVFSATTGLLVMYGGQGPEEEIIQSLTYTEPTEVKSDMWVLDVHSCPTNCSLHGDCHYGNCLCSDGYYGLDCSNTSCPGDYCYFDEITSQQVCEHCCQAGWTHRDTDSRVTIGDVYKLECSRERPGESHGICDGFGTCQCAPPFLGDDCGTKDCPNNCSFNGWCSVQFPVSACACDAGYYGEYCQYQECLNNCSYPQGLCNNVTGDCECRDVYSPYNSTRVWSTWAGEDCSYLPAFAGGSCVRPTPWVWAAAAILSLVFACVLVMDRED